MAETKRENKKKDLEKKTDFNLITYILFLSGLRLASSHVTAST